MIYDVSPPISPDIAVWPGDTPSRREVLMDTAQGDNLTLSTWHSTVHVGAHADAPSHFVDGAPTIDAVDPERYLGPCQVMRVQVARGRVLSPADLPSTPTERRLLLATDTFPDPRRFNEDFASLGVELVRFLDAAGVDLVGIDTPSVDPFDSKEMPAHKALLAHGMLNLEGLALDGVPEGRYELIALPLRLVGFDASPLRAILRTVDGA